MPARLVRLTVAAAATALGAAALLAPARALEAQGVAPRAPIFELTPYAGYMKFGNLVDGPLGTSITSAGGPMYGAQLGINLTKNVAVIGNVARASGDLQVGLPFLGGVSIGHNAAWLYDGGLQLSAPLGAATALPITPFVQVGAGAMRYDVGATLVNTTATNFAWNAGVGADVALGKVVSVRLMAKDYIGKFDTQQATGFGVNGTTSNNSALSAGLKLNF